MILIVSQKWQIWIRNEKGVLNEMNVPTYSGNLQTGEIVQWKLVLAYLLQSIYSVTTDKIIGTQLNETRNIGPKNPSIGKLTLAEYEGLQIHHISAVCYTKAVGKNYENFSEFMNAQEKAWSESDVRKYTKVGWLIMVNGRL